MFSKSIVSKDKFLSLSATARALYYQLGMEADDDGFVDNLRSVMASTGSSVDDVNLLLTRGFILSVDDGVMVILDWRTNNYIQNDRYTPTQYGYELSKLAQDENGRYYPLGSPDTVTAVVTRGTLIYPLFTTSPGGKQQPVHLDKKKRDKWPESLSQQQIKQLDTSSIQTVSSLETQVSKGKDRLGKDSTIAAALDSSMNLYSEPDPERGFGGGGKPANSLTQLREEWQENAGVWSGVLKTDILADLDDLQHKHGLSESDAVALIKTAMQETTRSTYKGVPTPALLDKILTRYEDTGTLTPDAVAAHEQEFKAAQSSPGNNHKTLDEIRKTVYHDSDWEEFDKQVAARKAREAFEAKRNGGEVDG
jgi:hypothetical protein